ncbi:hypothetical protein [Nostoc flagelliforme]|uniref:hypothetical protein n=1 Tax=Nostoc flagelliforme TaxID=1306274 RepID=UPI001F554C0A|nr:hypothetical protein [Nostoc flagelliforme]
MRSLHLHSLDGTLPVQEKEATPPTTENQIMAHIFNECQNYGFEILDDGIYNNNGVKLGQVGCTDGNWWVIQGYSGQQQYSNSVFDAVCSLSMLDTVPHAEAADCEELLDRPFEMLTTLDWELLREYAPVAESRELVTA